MSLTELYKYSLFGRALWLFHSSSFFPQLLVGVKGRVSVHSLAFPFASFAVTFPSAVSLHLYNMMLTDVCFAVTSCTSIEFYICKYS